MIMCMGGSLQLLLLPSTAAAAAAAEAPIFALKVDIGKTLASARRSICSNACCCMFLRRAFGAM